MTAKILAVVDTDNWASLAEVTITAGDGITITLSGPDGSIAATEPMSLRFDPPDAAALHQQLGKALGILLVLCLAVLAACSIPNAGSGDNAPDPEWSTPDAGVTAKATERDDYRASASFRCDRMCRWVSSPTWGACAPTWHYCYVGCMTTFESIPWACYWEFDSWLWHEWMAGPVECSHSWAADPPYSPYAESNRRAMWACWWNGGVQ